MNSWKKITKMISPKINVSIEILMFTFLVLTFLFAGDDSHILTAIIFGILVVTHLSLHWKFIINIPKIFSKK